MSMSVFTQTAFANHQQVVFCHDAASGLKAIIAIHDRTLGPACGGCRMWTYASEDDAIADALRLSRGMTYKNALAGNPLGGGKAVIIGHPAVDKNSALLRAFGKAVHRLGGHYITAEDVGMRVQDMEIIRSQTPYVIGLNSSDAASGNPAPWTARGVVVGIRAALLYRFGNPSPRGRTVAIQGLGQVGAALANEMHLQGARLIVADLDPRRVFDAVERYGAEADDPTTIHQASADVFSPCALGGVISSERLPVLGAPIIAGSANNQLADEHVGDLLAKHGILYAPDYVINAGGVINAAGEALGAYDSSVVMERVDRIGTTLEVIFRRAVREKRSTDAIAEAMAEDILARARLENAA
jgi:leucine dehydrogenase